MSKAKNAGRDKLRSASPRKIKVLEKLRDRDERLPRVG